MKLKYFIQTFGCAQNEADSQRLKSYFASRGMTEAKNIKEANYAIINTCMIRHSAQNRVNGLVHNLNEIKILKLKKKQIYKIIITGCMTGMAFRDKTGKFLQKLREQMPEVDEFMPIEEVGFDFAPLRTDKKTAWVPIANGCNNFCTYCVVPYTRGREISRPFDEIIKECRELIRKKYKNVTLLGQNVNSYGSDLVLGKPIEENYFGTKNMATNFKISGKLVKPTYVKHLGKARIPTLFPYLLQEVSKMGFEKVDFISSNPWDFSDELIDVIARNKNITRTVHLPVQSGDTNVLKRMNRWYSREEYLDVVKKLKSKVKDVKLTTDIIVGFCGETDQEFQNTVDLVKKVGFEKAYVAMYSERPMTIATKQMKDTVPYKTKKARWEVLEDLIFRSKHKKTASKML